MKKLSIKDIIEFRSKSERSKKSFAANIKVDKEKTESDGGGDYWVSCLSAISNSFRSKDLQYIIDKKEELEEKYEATEYKRTKAMYKRNIGVLYNYEDLDFRKWGHSKKLKFEKKHKDHSVLSIKGFDIKATPHHVFTYKRNDTNEIGAIWFIAKLNGFKKDELGMFAEIIYRYLKINFSNDYIINPKYCIAVDVYNSFDVNYSQVEKDEVPAILSSTLDEIKRLM